MFNAILSLSHAHEIFVTFIFKLFVRKRAAWLCWWPAYTHTKLGQFSNMYPVKIKRRYVVVCMRRSHTQIHWTEISQTNKHLMRFSLMIFTRKHCTHIHMHPHTATRSHTRTHIILNRWWFQKCEWFSCVILFLLFSLLDTLFRSCYLIAYSFISTELFHRKTSTHSTPQMPRSQQIKINKCRAVYKWAILVRILNRTSVQWMSLNGANENYFIQIMKHGNAFEI